MQVSFYLPEKYLPDVSRREAWKSGAITTLEESGKIACAQCWIYQTWLALEKSGCHVNLVHTLPEEGILITLAGCLGENFRPGPRMFFADIVADFVPHPAAHLHIVQNAIHARRLPYSVFMPLWPHPNLLPRDPERGDRFENLGFFGDAPNLAPELRDPVWQKSLHEQTGLTLRLVDASGWHDYRQMDCILAIRGFGSSSYLHKPATKLYNAWLAGVPFIGGWDSAYRGDARPGNEYLAVRSLADLARELHRLRNDVRFRRELVLAGSQRSRQFDRPAILERWRKLVEVTLPEAAARWNARSALGRRIFSRTQAALAWIDRRWRH
jgi:hypothetical protein